MYSGVGGAGQREGGERQEAEAESGEVRSAAAGVAGKTLYPPCLPLTRRCQ